MLKNFNISPGGDTDAQESAVPKGRFGLYPDILSLSFPLPQLGIRSSGEIGVVAIPKTLSPTIRYL